MPYLTRSVPAYRTHRASGQAVVTLNGRDFYLGPLSDRAHTDVARQGLVDGANCQEWLDHKPSLFGVYHVQCMMRVDDISSVCPGV